MSEEANIKHVEPAEEHSISMTGKILVIHEGAEFKTFPHLPIHIK